MKFEIIKGDLAKIKSDNLVFFVFEKNVPANLAKIDKKLNNLITNIIKKEYFTGAEKQIHSIYTHDKIRAEKILLVGMGSEKKFNTEKLRSAVGQVISYTKDQGCKELTFILPKDKYGLIGEMTTISIMSTYQFEHYKTKKSKDKKIEKINFYTPQSKDQYLNQLNQSQIIAQAVNWTRDLINHPSNFITPKILAKHAKELADKNLKINIFGHNDLIKMNMGLILGVSKGSDEEPQLIVLDYQPKNFKKTLVLVGKGLTFDSGGISIKPSDKMDEMKMDMSGGAAVLGVMKAITKLKPEIRVVAVVPATENLPSGKAIKPGDILYSVSGQTVEVLNTDAEGRLVLADALFYAQKYRPDAIIDLATLTGACLIALGHEAAGIIGNNQKLIERINRSANTTGEKVWQLPLWDEYRQHVKGELADLKNIGEGRTAGTINGAAFLENFVGKYPWVHVDIAGTAFGGKPKTYQQKGATGYGVRLLVDLIRNW